VFRGEYVDYESGQKGTEKRKQFAALFNDAAKRQFDCVLFWALDRFSREGMAQTIIHLQRLSSYGVAFHSYTEAHLATDNELVRCGTPRAGQRPARPHPSRLKHADVSSTDTVTATTRPVRK
jgi:S-adenosylmethionine/arginine decarboxylase-like enzyme